VVRDPSTGQLRALQRPRPVVGNRHGGRKKSSTSFVPPERKRGGPKSQKGVGSRFLSPSFSNKKEWQKGENPLRKMSRVLRLVGSLHARPPGKGKGEKKRTGTNERGYRGAVQGTITFGPGDDGGKMSTVWGSQPKATIL